MPSLMAPFDGIRHPRQEDTPHWSSIPQESSERFSVSDLNLIHTLETTTLKVKDASFLDSIMVLINLIVIGIVVRTRVRP